MNKTHRTIWNEALGAWVAVSEIVKSHIKSKRAKRLLATLLLGTALGSALAAPPNPPAPTALPTGGVVSAGAAIIGTASAVMTINQTSQRAAINWNTFDVGSAAKVNIEQPNAQAVLMNRVLDSNPSQIFGKITATGHVYLVNPSGVYFSPSASVDVGGLVATTHSMSDADFMAGSTTFKRNGATGSIENEGELRAKLDGYIALLAPNVINQGVIVAERGTAILASGESITLDFNAANKLTGIVVTASDVASLIENRQAIETPDGQIIMSAQSVSALRGSLIKNSGTLIANEGASTITHKGGRILLEGDEITLTSTSKIEAKGSQGGGTVLVGGDWQGSNGVYQATKTVMEAGATIDASATVNGDGGKVVLWSAVHNAASLTTAVGSIKAEGGALGGNGGQIETSGHKLAVDGIAVSTKAAQGATGKWLLDPYNITISGADSNTSNTGGTFTASADSSTIAASTLIAALVGSGVEVSTAGAGGTQAGDITVASAITSTSGNSLMLRADGAVAVNAPISLTGGFEVVAHGNVGLNTTTASHIYVNTSGDISDGGVLSTPHLQLIGRDILFSQTHAVGNLAASARSIAFRNGTALTVGSESTTLVGGSTVTTHGVSASGPARTVSSDPLLGYVILETLTGNLTIDGPVTSNQSSFSGQYMSPGTFQSVLGVKVAEPIYLLAGSGSAAGTSTGGDIVFGANAAVSTTGVGKILLFTGSVAGTSVSGHVAGNTRYSLDKSFLDYGGYTPGLGNSLGPRLTPDNGISVLYRESPNVTITGQQVTVTYGDVTNPNIPMGDVAVGGATYTASAPGAAWYGTGPTITGIDPSMQPSMPMTLTTSAEQYSSAYRLKVGTYTLTNNIATGLNAGYGFTVTSSTNGSLTVDQKVIDPQFIVTDRYYDGTRNVPAGNVTVNGVIPLSGTYDNSQSANGGGIMGNRLDGLSLSYTASYADQNVQYDSNNAPAAQAVTFSNFVLGGQSLYSRWADDSANYRVLNPSVTTTAKILPRPITVDATKSKSYDGTTAIVLASSDYAINNVVSGESFSLTANPVRDAGTYSSANAGLRTITVGGYNPSGDLVAAVGTDPANYSLPNVVTGSGTISPLTATVTYTKTYDASATSTITCSPTVVCPGFTITGLPTGFTGAIYTSSGSVLNIAANSAQVYQNGTNYLSSLGTATLLVDAAGGTNYVSANGNILIAAGSVATAPVTINPKALTLSASGLDKTYDATTVLPVGYTLVLSGKIGSDDVSLLPAVGSFDSPNAGSRTASLSQLVLTGGQGSNYSVSSTANFSATIAQRSISSLSGTKEYDGTSTFTSANMTPTVAGGSVEALTFTDLASTTNGTTAQTFGAGVPSSASFGALSITSAAGDVTANYSLPGQMLVPLTTTKRTITLSANDPNTPAWYKVYDGTTATGNGALSAPGYEGVSADTFLSTNFTLQGVQPYLRNNQLVSLNKTVNAATPVIVIGNTVSGVPATMNDFSFTGVLSSSNAGSTNLVVTPTLSGPSSQYYQLAGGYTFNLPAQIGRVPLNVSVSAFSGTIAAVSRVYDGTNNINSAAWTSSVTSGSAVGSDNYGSINLTAKAVTSASDETAIKNVGSVSYVMLSPSFNGPQGGNYLPIITSFQDPLSNINSAGTNGFPPTAAPTTTGAYISRISGYSITQKRVTLSASKVYDGTAIYSLSDITPNTGVAGEVLTISSANPYAIFYSGIHNADGTMTLDPNVNAPGRSLFVYAKTNSTDGSLAVSPAAFGLAPANGNTLVSNYVFYNPGGGVFGYSPTNPTTQVATNSASNSGTLPYNYIDVGMTLAGSSAAITAKDLTVTGGLSVNNKTYDGTTAATINTSSISFSGLIAADTGNVLLDVTGASFSSPNVGSQTVSLVYNSSGSAAGNYRLIAPNTLTGDITAAPITIIANGVSKQYGTTGILSNTAFSVTGLQNGETIGTVALASAGTVNTSNAGDFAITTSNAAGGTFSASNYAITYSNAGLLTVTKAPLTISGQYGLSKVYDGLTTATLSGGNLSGILFSDVVGMTQLGTFSSANAGNQAIVAGNVLTGAAADNYQIVQPTGLSAYILPASLTIATNSMSSVYGAGTTLGTTAFTATGLKQSDQVAAVTLSSSGAASSSNVGSYSITPSAATGGQFNAGNYEITYVNGTLSVTPASLTVTATNASKTYDGQAYSGGNGLSYSGFVNNDTSAVLSGSASYAGSSQGAINAGTYSIVPSGLSAINYDITYANASLLVAPKSVTVTGATVNNKVYDGTTTATFLASGTVSTGIVGESVSVVPGTATFSDASAATGKSVTLTGFSLLNGTGGLASNYVLSSTSATTTADIEQKSLTVTGLAAINKTYDGNATASITNWGSVVTGVGSETLTLNSGTASFADANAGVNKTVTASGYSLTNGSNGGLASNYVLSSTSSTTTANIDKRALVVTGANNTVTYNSTAQTNSGASYSGQIGSESFTITGYGSGTHAGSYADNLSVTAGSGTLLSNYNVSYTNGALTVNKVLLGISATSTYGGSTTITPTTLTLTGLVGADIAETVTSLVINSKDVATASYITGFSLSNFAEGNYQLNAGVNTTLGQNTTNTVVLSAKALSMSGLSVPVSRAYDGTTVATVNGTPTLGGTSPLGLGTESNGLRYFADTVSITGTPTGTYNSSHVASASTVTFGGLSLTGGDAGNYTLTMQSPASATITPATLTSTLTNTGVTKVYDGTATSTITPTYSVTGFVAGDTAAALSHTAVAYNSKDVLTASQVTVSGLAISGITGSNNSVAGDYALDATSKTVAATITPAALTLTANSTSKTYGDTLTFLGTEFGHSGLQNGETVGSVSLASTGAASTANVAGSPYAITAGSATGGTFNANNYSISYVDGALTVTRRALTVGNLVVSNKTYDGLATAAIDVSGATYTGLVSGDDVSVSITGANFASANAGTHNVILSSNATGASVNNYSVVAPGSLTGTISQAPVTVTADAKSMSYGGNTLPALTYTHSGLVGSDAFSGALSTAATAYNGTPGSASNAGTYAILQNTLSAGSNYALTYVGANLTVNKVQLTVTGNSPSMTYGGNSLPTLSAAISGYVNGDSAAAGLSGSPTLTTTATAYNGTAGSGSNAGSYPVSASVAGMSSTNYTFAPAVVEGVLTVNPATLTYTANAATTTYGATPTLSGAVSGFVNGDLQATATTGSLSFTTAGGDVGNREITGSGLAANNGNYTFVQAAGNTAALTVTPASLTVTANDQAKTYDGLGHTAGVSYTGFVYGQNASVLGGSMNLAGASTNDGSVYNGAVTPGSYDVTPAGLTSSNYAISYATGLLTIDPAPLTVTARNATKVQDNRPYSGGNGVNYTGFVNGENASVLSGALTYTGSSQNATRVGSFNIMPGGLSSTNYDLSFVAGRLTITAKLATDNLASNLLTSVTPTPSPAVTAQKQVVAATLPPVIVVPTTTVAATGLGGFKVVAAPQPNVLDVVFVPNPATPQNIVEVIQVPLSSGQATIPDNITDPLYLAAGVVTAPAVSNTAATGTASGPTVASTTGSTGAQDSGTPVNPSVPSVAPVQLSLGAGQGALPANVVNDLLAAAGTSTASASTDATASDDRRAQGSDTASDGTGTQTAGAAGGSGAATTVAGTSGSGGSASTVASAGSTTQTSDAAGNQSTTTTASSGSTTTSTKKTVVTAEQSQLTTVLANDAPLPTQLVFNPSDKTFTIAKGADIKLPLQVKIQLRQGGSVVSEKLVMLTNEF